MNMVKTIKKAIIDVIIKTEATEVQLGIVYVLVLIILGLLVYIVHALCIDRIY